MEFAKKVLVTGVSGMLGKDVARCFLSNSKYDVYGVSRSQPNYLEGVETISLDLTNFNELNIFLNKINPDIIIHSAANVNIEECEKNKELAFKINAEVVDVLASYEPSTTKFIYISTDSIFGGEKGNYDEVDEENPLNNYAKSKLKGERNALNQNPESIVVRTNIIGFHIPWGKSLVEWALDSLNYEKNIYGFKDTYFNPVYTKQLARLIIKLIENTDYKEIINIGSKNYISKYEFLLKLARLFDYDTDLIQPSSIERLESNVERPKNTTLNIDRLKSILNVGQDINLKFGLKELKNDLLKNYNGED